MKKLFVLIFTLTLSLTHLANVFWKSACDKYVDAGMKVFDKKAAEGNPIRDYFGKPRTRKEQEQRLRKACSVVSDEEIHFFLEMQKK